jgi:hypothetical protein
MRETELERGSPPYVLGHSSGEIERLMAQARLIDPITERFFRAAGVTSGMKVLDVGSGAGDVAFLAAPLWESKAPWWASIGRPRRSRSCVAAPRR